MLRNAISSFFVLCAAAAFGQNAITLEDIWKNGTYRAEGVYGIRSLKDGKHYTTLQNGNVIRYEYKSGDSVEAVVNADKIEFDGAEIDIVSYAFNPQETKLLLGTERTKLYRHSASYRYFVYERKDGTLSELADGKQVFHATFSPNSDQVAYVFENNIYVEDLTSDETVQLTDNGRKNHIINGMSDWVYEEEFGFTKAFQWSPDGRYLAYYEFNESDVPEFAMTRYGQRLYPEEERFKYPKAGEKNSDVRIFIHNVDKDTRVIADLGDMNDMYIPRIKWTKEPSTVSIQRMNRLQNRLELVFAHAVTGKSRVVLSETSETYIDITDDLTFLDDGREFIWSSERDGFNHLYLYDVNGTVKAQLTSGKWEVTDFYGVDDRGKHFYYRSNEENTIQRHVYSASLNGKWKRKLTDKKGQHSASFSHTMDYFINTYSNANTPPLVTLRNDKGKQIRVLKDNATLRARLDSLDHVPQKEFFSFTPEHGTSLNGWMMKPANFDPERKYPVMLMIYGGPGSNTVNDAWGGANQLWYAMLAEQGYIIVSVDNRGTGGRGRDFKHATYQQLGKLETEDMIATARHLTTLGFVNPFRIGIFGWSYGGYMSSLAITKGADHFAAAIAVAPVTNWRFYDTIYTERYMRTPQENGSGYDDNSPINHVEKLEGAYLLVHGMADDNVHFQNTVEMTEALIRANKQFDTYIYPDRNHGIYGKNARLHLYTKMTDFIVKNL